MPIIFLNSARGFSRMFSLFTDYNVASTVFFHYLFRCRRDLLGTKDFAFIQNKNTRQEACFIRVLEG